MMCLFPPLECNHVDIHCAGFQHSLWLVVVAYLFDCDETVDVLHSLSSATKISNPYLRDRLDRIAGLAISRCAILKLARSVSAVLDDNQCVQHT